MDSNALANFMMSHSMMTPDQWEQHQKEQRQARARSEFEAAALEGFDDEPAGKNAREKLQKFVAWRDKTAGELSDLQAKRQRLQSTVDAPAQIAGRRAGLLKALASALLRGDDPDMTDATAADTALAVANARAEAARLAVVELDVEIDKKQLQVKRLRERQQSLVQAAMVEHVAETWGARYRKAVDELRACVQQIDAAKRAADLGGLSVVIPENHRQRVETYFDLPDFNLLKGFEGRITSANRAALEPWRDLIKEWSK
jgi:hypothetical protein